MIARRSNYHTHVRLLKSLHHPNSVIGSATSVSVPSLFFGRFNPAGNDIRDETGEAFNPGPANLQPVNDNLYINAQFGPENSGNSDGEFETKMKNEVDTGTDYAGGNVLWVDDWWAYHLLSGELHCGSIVIRDLPTFKWWEK